jgi:hypothetical protein
MRRKGRRAWFASAGRGLFFCRLVSATYKISAMLKPRLLNLIHRELRAQNLQVSPSCTQQIEQLVNNGVQRMRLDKADQHAGHVMQAELNLKALIRYLGEYARDEGSFPKLNDASFDAALSRCPTFWPFLSSG